MIPYFRREKSIKQIDLAEALKVSPSYLCKIEKGTQEPTNKFIKEISEFLGVPQNELFPAKRRKRDKIQKINNTYSNKLWSVRRERGIKQYELAKKLDCSPSYLSKVEKGLQQPNDRFKKKCAKILKVKEVELFSTT